ncbi:MAG TPA: S9 family peptidase [bacterium]|nr:S9 family peptidase [bacterium]
MPRNVRIEDLYRFILPGSPALSPCGRQVAFTVKRVERKENRYVSHLWIVPSRGGRPRQLTRGTVSDSAPVWSPDGRELAFVSDRDDKTDIWTLSLEGGEPRRVTDLGGGSVSNVSWSPDGRELLFEFFSVPKKTDEQKKKEPTVRHVTRLYHKEDGFGWFNNEFWTVWKVNVRTGRATALSKGDHHDHAPRWSPDGKRIAFVSNRREDRDRWPDLSSIFVMDRNGRGVREITPTSGVRDNVRWSRDGRHLYWSGYEGGPGEWLYHEHSVWRGAVTGKAKAEALNPGHDRWVMNMVGSDAAMAGFGSVMEVYADAEGNERVAFGSDEDGSYRIYSVSSAGGDVRREVDGKLSVLALSVGAGDGPDAVAMIGTVNDTGELHRVRLDGSGGGKQLTKLTAPFFRPLKFQTPEEIRVKSGRHEIQAWVLKPPGFRKGKKYPCLIEVHGGPMTQYGESWFHEMHVLAAKGWVVAYCNPRGSSGRGMKFANVIDGKWGKDDWADVTALTDHMARRPYVDSKRLGILGGSYGGFMTTWALGHTDRYRAGVTQRQLSDWRTQAGSSDFGQYDLFHFDNKEPWEAPDVYFKASPYASVAKIKTPLLIIHSEGDLRCPVAQSEALFVAMKSLDQAPCELVRFHGEFHGLSRGGKPANRVERLKHIVRWFEKYL